MMRIFRLCVFLLLVLCAVIGTTGLSEPGLRMLLGGVQYASGGLFRCGGVQGTLLRGFRVDNVAVTTAELALRLGRITFAWQPRLLFDGRLQIDTLDLADVEVRLRSLAEGDTAGGGSEQSKSTLGDLALPVAIDLRSFTLTNGRLLGPDFSEYVRIDQLGMALAASGSELILEKFFLRSPGYDGDLAGRIAMAENWPLELAGDVVFRDFGVGPIAGRINIAGPLARLGVEVDARGPGYGRVTGQLLDLPEKFRWEAELDLHEVELHRAHAILPEMRFDVWGKAHGEDLTYNGNLTGVLDYLYFHDVQCTIELHGDENQITFPRVDVENSYGGAQLTDGLLSWQDDLIWRARLETFALNPAIVLPGYDGKLDTELFSSGIYGDEGLRFLFDVEKVAGSLRGYELQGKGRLEVGPDRATVSGLELINGTSRLQFDGGIGSEAGLEYWQDTLHWQGTLALDAFDPGIFLSDYPGELAGRISSEGVLTHGVGLGTVSLEKLKGEVRGYPVLGEGAARLVGRDVILDNLVVSSGSAALTASGATGDETALSFTLKAPDIGELLADSQGSVNLDGNLRTTGGDLQIRAQGQAKRIAFAGSGVQMLSVELLGGLMSESPLEVKVRGEGIRSGEIVADRAMIDIAGSLAQHRLGVTISGEGVEVSGGGDGGVTEALGWQGTLDTLKVVHPLAGAWQLASPAQVQLAPEKLVISSLCLAGAGDTLCADGQMEPESGRWRAGLKGSGLQLEHLGNVLAGGGSLHGALDISLMAAGNREELEAAEGRITVRRLQLTDVAVMPELLDLTLEQGEMALGLDQRMLTTTFALALADGSSLQGQVDAAGFGRFDTPVDTLRLAGRAEVDFRSIDFLAPLTDYMVTPTGNLVGNLTLGGTVKTPVLGGRLALGEGKVDIPDLGVALQDVVVNLEGNDGGVALQLEATSGGKLLVNGTLGPDAEGVRGELTILGSNIETARLPEYSLTTSPNLLFVFDGHNGNLTGNVHVPTARISPERLTEAVKVSDDVIYLDEGETTNGSYGFAMDMGITLGDDVRIEGYGITGRLFGKVQVSKQPGETMRGQGTISLDEGMFIMYGKQLTLERSRLLFGGGPIDNPGIDVRAKKRVADNRRINETLEVGVEVGGTADNLEVELFSNPPMEEKDILAYMVVGRAMSDVGEQDAGLLGSAAMALGLEKEMGGLEELTGILPVDEVFLEGEEEGEMSVVVGKHLTRELFIGYGHNFFDQEGELRLRYDLGRGFSIETRSSGDKTGADLLYSFEK